MYESDIRINSVVSSDGAGKCTYQAFFFEGTNDKYYFSTRNTYIWAKILSYIYCSRITVAHVDVNIFVKNHLISLNLCLQDGRTKEVYLKPGMVISYVKVHSILRKTLSA